MGKIVKIITVNKGEEDEKAAELAAFYNEHRAIGNRISHVTVSAVGNALNITVYADEADGVKSDVILPVREFVIIRVEPGRENEGAVRIAEFYNSHRLPGSRTGELIQMAVGRDMTYLICADTISV